MLGLSRTVFSARSIVKLLLFYQALIFAMEHGLLPKSAERIWAHKDSKGCEDTVLQGRKGWTRSTIERAIRILENAIDTVQGIAGSRFENTGHVWRLRGITLHSEFMRQVLQEADIDVVQGKHKENAPLQSNDRWELRHDEFEIHLSYAMQYQRKKQRR